jgi:lipopolysaccharide/colanic/teichoic acid biosynthesis glycosyltransferase
LTSNQITGRHADVVITLLTIASVWLHIFLRESSLDSLPQFNVLRGDMSLTAQRPTSFAAGTDELRERGKLAPTPEINGLWRARLDILYIQSRRLWLDMKPALRTFLSLNSGFSESGNFCWL